MWILLFLVVGFVVWHFIPQPDLNRPAPRFRKEMRATASDPQWIRFIEEHCESPAEEAFVRAMVRAYDLKPVDGALFGKGVRLDFQVEEGSYRVDFLANRWLIIEIDGAAYHSSSEAVARDKARDEHLEGLGYSVVRIPARVVFNAPEEAVQRVRAALRIGKRALPVRVQKTGWQKLSQTMSSISNGIAEIDAFVDRSRAIDEALKDAKTAFDTEKCLIECALASAMSELETADWLQSRDQRMRDIFEKNFADITKAMADTAGEDRAADKVEVRVFPPAPPSHRNPEHNAVIQQAYARIAEARLAFLEEQRLKVMADPRLPSVVEKELRELGCPEYWALMRGNDDLAASRA